MTRAEILRRLGPEDAQSLFREFGGTRLAIPATLKDAARLEAIFGHRLATRLVLHFGGTRGYIPHDGPTRRIDHKAAKSLIAKGISNARIARKLECSERAIEKLRVKLRAKSTKGTENA
jgi:DNA-binding NarL/FixJ family response regulator